MKTRDFKSPVLSLIERKIDMNTFELLCKARSAYPSNPIMTDFEFDALLVSYLDSPDCTEEQRLLLLSPYEYSAVPETSSDLDFSIHSVSEIQDINRFAYIHPDESFVVSGKIDGIRANVTYSYSAQDACFLRGDVLPRSGSFILHDVVQRKFPLKVKLPPNLKDSFSISAELYVNQNDLSEVSFRKGFRYSTALNAANSLARTGISEGSESLLSVAVHRVFHPKLTTKIRELEFANKLGLATVPHKMCTSLTLEDTIKDVRNMMLDLKIPTDGLVISRNKTVSESLSLTLGKTSYSDMIAYKPEEWVKSLYTAKVIGLTFEDKGDHYNAKILVDPVLTREGKVVREVNGHSLQLVKRHEIQIGSIIIFRFESNNHIEIERRLY